MAKKTTKGPQDPKLVTKTVAAKDGDAGERGLHGEIGKAGKLGRHTHQEEA